MTRNNKHDSNCNLNIVLIVIIAALIILTPLQTMDLYEL